jgi:hypothetical protein
MSTPTPIAFEIARIGQKEERIIADSVDVEGNPPKYVFRKAGVVVHEIFVHALEREPRPIFPQTPEQKEAWRKFARKQSELNTPTYLDRD